jgi:tRNA modification GTPase
VRTGTIAALASPPGAALRGVIRLSGPDCAAIVERAARLSAPLGARGVYRGRLWDGRGEQPLLVLWMPAPRSYTREDVAELHLPGSPWLLDAALRRVLELGAELAEPGEFTRRAFERGRIDLLQAEGVLEVVSAGDQAERRAGLALLAGGLGRRVAELRDQLEELRALCEASLDFDEADTASVPAAELLALCARAERELAEALAFEERREPLSDLPCAVLAGAPNAGKSTLFNRLCPGSRALVSDLAGTTRDFLVGLWPLGPRAVRLIDTAGLDASLAESAEPDRLAQERAREQQAAADLVLWLADPFSEAAANVERDLDALPQGPARCLVWTKLDLGQRPTEALPKVAGLPGVRVSAATGEGLAELETACRRALGLGEVQGAREPGTARALGLRHRRALEIAREALREAQEGIAASAPLDLAADALRRATDALDGIQGRTTSEDVLDRIFERFCLGK